MWRHPRGEGICARIDFRRRAASLTLTSATAAADAQIFRNDKLRATLGLLLAAARLGQTSAAQQLLRIDPSAARGDEQGAAASQGCTRRFFPAQVAAMSDAEDPSQQERHFPVLRLLLAAAPQLAHSTGCTDGEMDGWTLLRGAAYSGNVEAIQLLLQRASDLVQAVTSFGCVPLHVAARQGHAEAVRLLLQAAPGTSTALDYQQQLPVHWAAEGGHTESLRLLIDAAREDSSELQRQLAAPDEDGNLPLHLAAWASNAAAVRLLLEAAPEAALVQNNEHRRPLQEALHPYWHGGQIRVDAARALLPASGRDASQLLDALAAVPAWQRADAQLLYADLAVHVPLTAAQWQRVPSPCPALGRALPAVLARSEAEAAQLVARLPPADAVRLRLAALSLHRQQGSLQLEAELLGELVNKMLALSLSDDA